MAFTVRNHAGEALTTWRKTSSGAVRIYPGGKSVQMASSISQYGITWTFDQEYPVGQFVNGDWWVVGPITVTSVSPAPTTRLAGENDDDLIGETGLQVNDDMRNGSMVPTTVTVENGYDSRSVAYNPDLSIEYPYGLAANRTLVSTISAATPQNWDGEIIGDGGGARVLSTAAVLTCLSEPPPPNSFRPPYWGTDKPMFSASDIRWDRLLSLAPVGDVPDIADYVRYVQRVWLDDMQAYWHEQWLLPYENQPAYGRANATLMGTAGLLANCNFTQEQKRPLVYGIIQIGIDLAGILQANTCFRASGGHGSGRKFPVIFAGLMLDDDPYFHFDADRVGMDAGEDSDGPQGIWPEDVQTYWGETYYGAPACFQMVAYNDIVQPHQENWPPYEGMDETSEDYRLCCTVNSWIGQALSILMMGAKSKWNHDAYFQVCDDWMAIPDPYEANRGEWPRLTDWQETWAWDDWTTEMWREYRDTVPAQAGGTDNLKWEMTLGAPRWVNNPPEGDSEPPTVPTGLASSNITADSFTVTWNESDDNVAVAKYEVRIDGGTPVERTTLSYIATGLSPETQYEVEVRAGDQADNWSDWSDPLVVETAEDTGAPAPDVAFEFNEGSGTTATSTAGGYTLTTLDAGWGTNGITRRGIGYVDGNVASTYTQWTIATRAWFVANPSGDRTWLSNNNTYVNRLADGKLRVYGNSTVTSTNAVTNGEWHIIVIVQDADPSLKVYVDGVLVITVPGNHAYSRAHQLDLLFEVGANNTELDWLHFWTTSLSGGQISSIT